MRPARRVRRARFASTFRVYSRVAAKRNRNRRPDALARRVVEGGPRAARLRARAARRHRPRGEPSSKRGRARVWREGQAAW